MQAMLERNMLAYLINQHNLNFYSARYAKRDTLAYPIN